MRILDRYLIVAVGAATLLVLLVLLSLTGFINFIGQLDDVGTGSYRISDALVHVLLSIPRHAYEMFPIAVLLGALLGLGGLASHSELVVMRAAGVSVWRLAGAVLLAGLILAVLAALIGELVAPSAEQFAKRHRMLAMHEDINLAGTQSAWIKDGDLIYEIEQIAGGSRLGGVRRFELDGGQRLHSVSQALSAGFGASGNWYLYDFRATEINEQGVFTRHESRVEQSTRLSPALVSLSVVDPDGLESRGLYEYASYLRENGLDAYRYEVAFWSRVSNTVAVLLMAGLALPFVFGPLRSAGAGARLMVGVLLGIAYLVGARTLESSGAVFEVNAIIIGWLPSAVLAVVVLLGLLRIR